MGENQGRLARQISLWESAIDDPTRMKRWIKYSINSWEESHKPLSLFFMGDFNLGEVQHSKETTGLVSSPK